MILADISKDALEDPFDPEEEEQEADKSANEGQNMFRQKALSVQSDRLKKVNSLKTGKKNAEPRTAGAMAGNKETGSNTKKSSKQEYDKEKEPAKKLPKSKKKKLVKEADEVTNATLEKKTAKGKSKKTAKQARVSKIQEDDYEKTLPKNKSEEVAAKPSTNPPRTRSKTLSANK